MIQRRSIQALVASAGVALVMLTASGAAQAHGGVSWSVGIGVPGVAVGVASPQPYYYSPPAPAYYAPQPVYVPPPPVYYRPARPVYYAPPVVVAPPAVYYGGGYRGDRGYRHGHRGYYEDRRGWR